MTYGAVLDGSLDHLPRGRVRANLPGAEDHAIVDDALREHGKRRWCLVSEHDLLGGRHCDV